MLRRYKYIKTIKNDFFPLILFSELREVIFSGFCVRSISNMNTFGTFFLICATLTQIVFRAGNGFVIEQSTLTPTLPHEPLSQSESLAVRQLSFNVDNGSGRRPGMFGDANTFGDTSLGILRGTSLMLAEVLVNAFSGFTTFINMIQNYAQTGSFQLDNLSSSSQVLTSRLLDLGSSAATSVLNMLSNEMSSSAANGAASLSGFNAAIPSAQFITSESRPVRPLQIDTGRQSSSTTLPVNGGNANASGALGISGQSASISSSQPQIGASFPAASGLSNSPGMFGQRVGVASTSGGGNAGGQPGWNSVFGWGAPGNGVSWSSSGSGNSFGWGAPNGVAGWRGNPAGVAGWSGANGLSGSEGVNSASGLGGMNGGSGSVGYWGGANGISGSSGSNGMAGGWYYPNGVGGWYPPNGMIGWRGSPIGIWGPVGGLSTSAASGGLSGWGGPTVGWNGPLGVGGWGNGASGSGASSGAFGWNAPGGVVGWSGPAGVSGWGGADGVSGSGGLGGISGSGGFGGNSGSGGFGVNSGSGSFGGVSGWDSSFGFDPDVSGADFMNDFAMYGAGGSNSTSTASPLLQLFETIVSQGFSQPTTGKVNPSLESSTSGNNNKNSTSTVVNP